MVGFSHLALKLGSRLPKIVLFASMKALYKRWEMLFFHLKSSFCSQDIWMFLLPFWSCRKDDLIRKIRLISKFMTSQPGQQTIPIHILPNTSQSKGNQVMKFSQVIEDNKGNISPSKFMQKISQGNCFQISFFVSYKSFVCVKNKWSAA